MLLRLAQTTQIERCFDVLTIRRVHFEGRCIVRIDFLRVISIFNDRAGDGSKLLTAESE